MSKVYTEQKSPFLAGTLSVIPGLGQIYNEQTIKGILLFVLFVGTFFLFVLRFSPIQFLDHLGMEISVYRGMIRTFPTPGISRFYPLLWFIVIFPFFIVFSITDAVQTARRINLGFSPKVTPQPVAQPVAPPPNPPAAEFVQQETLRTEAQAKLDPAAATATFQSSTEETMNNQNSNQQNAVPPTPPHARCSRDSRGVSGKFFLGIVLMVVGGTFILEDFFHIPVWDFDTWNRLWPLIPMLFGLRLLREYQRDHDRGQFVMGFLFTAVGSVFLLDRWTHFDILDFLDHYWMFILFGVGVLFVLTDIKERLHRQR